MSDLAEAIERVGRAIEGWKPEHFAGDVSLLLDAARRVSEGEQVQWCEEHESPMFSSKKCDWAWSNTPDNLCSIVPKLLVDILSTSDSD